MNKLPNAPLIEVIFELIWPINNNKDREKFQFMLGDIYSKLKHKYPNRQNLVSAPNFEIPLEVFINKPMYRFTKNESYPLYQIGPGLLSVNTIDSFYSWSDFEQEILEVTEALNYSYDFEESTQLNYGLKYINFFQFDFNKNNAFDYLSEYLHLDIKHNLQPDNIIPMFFSLAIGYPCDLGLFNTVINRGNYNGEEGFIIETNVTKQLISANLEALSSWLEESHDFLSRKFKKMTKGALYNSFKEPKV